MPFHPHSQSNLGWDLGMPTCFLLLSYSWWNHEHHDENNNINWRHGRSQPSKKRSITNCVISCRWHGSHYVRRGAKFDQGCGDVLKLFLHILALELNWDTSNVWCSNNMQKLGWTTCWRNGSGHKTRTCQQQCWTHHFTSTLTQKMLAIFDRNKKLKFWFWAYVPLFGKGIIVNSIFLHYNGSFLMCGHVSRRWAKDVNICWQFFMGLKWTQSKVTG
jgi:hypothetical protein